jgi:hypothetical protein
MTKSRNIRPRRWMTREGQREIEEAQVRHLPSGWRWAQRWPEPSRDDARKQLAEAERMAAQYRLSTR